MRVAVVTSVGQCGIAEHSAMLRQHVQDADNTIVLSSNPDWLDPARFMVDAPERFDLVHLNYHRGLHSRWTPEALGVMPGPFVITFHDTYETQPDQLPWKLLDTHNVRAMVVHEPCDLESHPKVRYWRQACPERSTRDILHVFPPPWRPTLGTLGFDFPWKNYTMLARVTGELGWNLRIIGQVPAERIAELRTLNPNLYCDGFVAQDYALASLERCDATAFLYDCANSGTSGAIRLGIAAGRPLCATDGCRQFRDLWLLDTVRSVTGIDWIKPNAADLRVFLRKGVGIWAGPRGYALDLVAFAHQERWPLLGQKYAALYHEVLNG